MIRNGRSSLHRLELLPLAVSLSVTSPAPTAMSLTAVSSHTFISWVCPAWVVHTHSHFRLVSSSDTQEAATLRCEASVGRALSLHHTGACVT